MPSSWDDVKFHRAVPHRRYPAFYSYDGTSRRRVAASIRVTPERVLSGACIFAGHYKSILPFPVLCSPLFPVHTSIEAQQTRARRSSTGRFGYLVPAGPSGRLATGAIVTEKMHARHAV